MQRQHSWHEGIQACKARSQPDAVIGNGAHLKGIDSSQSADMSKFRATTAVTNAFTFTSVNSLTTMSDTAPITTTNYDASMINSHRTSGSKTTITQGHAIVFKITVVVLFILGLFI